MRPSLTNVIPDAIQYCDALDSLFHQDSKQRLSQTIFATVTSVLQAKGLRGLQGPGIHGSLRVNCVLAQVAKVDQGHNYWITGYYPRRQIYITVFTLTRESFCSVVCTCQPKGQKLGHFQRFNRCKSLHPFPDRDYQPFRIFLCLTIVSWTGLSLRQKVVAIQDGNRASVRSYCFAMAELPGERGDIR